MVALEALVLTCALAAGGDAVLLDFTAAWCGPCRMMEPTVERLAAEGYPIRKVDIDQHPDLAARYGVRSVPCFILVSGGREVDRVVGAASRERLVQMFAAARMPPAGEAVVRGQSPSPGLLGSLGGLAKSAFPNRGENRADHDSRGAFEQRAMAASVRLKVDDPDGHSYGAGTIIDAHGEHALVLTCAHIFRDSQGRGTTTVDLFTPGGVSTVPAHVLRFDLERDVALVAIRPGMPVAPVRVAPPSRLPQRGEGAFSIGCDRGAEPSLRPSRIQSLNRYEGPDNIQAAGMPIDGRSGGGLFTHDGFLIGVCNAADPQDDEGLYAGPKSIYSLLDATGLAGIYRTPPGPAAGLVDATPSRDHKLPPAMPSAAAADFDYHAGPTSASMETALHPTAERQSNVAELADLPAIGRGDNEVICIIRSRTTGQQHRVVVIDRPSPDLLRQLASEARPGGADTSLASRESTVTGVRRPIVRGQSDE